MEIAIRPAGEADIEPILALINGYAAQNIMLPRTAEQIRRALKWFLVAEQEGRIVGCGSIIELTPELTELRSLAVAPDIRGGGLGRRLVAALIDKAHAAGYAQLCALTLNEPFFNRCGFVTIDRWTISPKIWHECVYCPKFDACDEIAVFMNLAEPEKPPEQLPPEVRMEMWQGLKLGRLQMLKAREDSYQ
jgi:amino-acid N-acetyltransferase